MMYKSSKGEVEIDTMPLSYAKNALNKLRRTEPERTAEIEALDAHVSKLEAEAIEKNRTPQPREAKIGDNNPPPDDPGQTVNGRAAIVVHVDDLLDQVKSCPLAIADDKQADDIARLHRDLQAAVKLVDNAADDEKRPHNDALAEISVWQNAYTAKKLKRTPDGSLTKALLATSNLSSAWLRKRDEERKQREQETAAAAAKAAQEAIALREKAKTSTDLEQMDKAEDALAAAKNLIRLAEGVAKEKVQAGGGEGFRAVGLRSVWSAQPTGEPGAWGAAYAHYKTNPEFMAEFHALIQRWADRDARTEATRVRGIPGFIVQEEKVAA